MTTDPTRNSLVDAIASKVELADRTADPTERAKLEGSIRRMVKALDEDRYAALDVADDRRGHPVTCRRRCCA